MLDIQGGQPAPVATAPVPSATQPAAPLSSIPGVGSPSNRLTYVTAGIALVIIVAAGGYVSFVHADRLATLATRNREIAALKTQLGTPDLVKIATTADQLKLGINSLQSALSTPSPWSPLLTALATRTPSSVVLSSVTADAKLNVRLNGSASSYSDVAKLLASLQDSPSFSQVSLDSSAKSDTTSGTSVAFALKATFVPPVATDTTAATTPATARSTQ